MQCIQMALQHGRLRKQVVKNNHYYGLGALYRSKEAMGALFLKLWTTKMKLVLSTIRSIISTIGGYWQIGQIRPMAIYQYQWGRGSLQTAYRPSRNPN